MDHTATCWFLTMGECHMQLPLHHFVLDRVISAIERTTRIGQKKVTLETRLAPDLALSRFGKLKLAIFLEEVFDVELSNERMAQFVTVADIVKYIGGHGSTNWPMSSNGNPGPTEASGRLAALPFRNSNLHSPSVR